MTDYRAKTYLPAPPLVAATERDQKNLAHVTDLAVEVYYTKGGPNYFSGETTRRGYYLSVQPVERKDGTVRFVLFTGIKFLVAEAKAANAKKFAELAARLMPKADAIAAAYAAGDHSGIAALIAA